MSSEDDSLTQYKLQLLSVEESLKLATSENQADLLDLKAKLTEVISLLQGSQPEDKSDCGNETTESQDEGINDEFLRFQREIQQLETAADDEEGTEDTAAQEEFCNVLSSMEGNKCRAPFMREWGEKGFHNAIIFSTDLEEQDLENSQDVLVKVMFCNPICDQMKPCPFFLDGHCRFTDEECRFSHGCSVKFSDLEEYVLPDYSSVQRDTKCLAKYKDGLWYSAVVENCLSNHTFLVKYSNSKDTDTLPAHDILPFCNLTQSDDESSSSEEAAPPIEASPVRNEIHYKVVPSASPIGTWEQHTKGIGSKLMAKMGHVWGQGLGKNSDGRLDPVEAIVLPRGKSLDKCIEIREMTGLVSVEDRFSSEQSKEERRSKSIEKNQSSETSVFAFLNKNISRGNGEYKNSAASSRKRPSEDSAASRSENTDLNFEMYSVGEEIKKTRREIGRLQQAVKRNAERNEAACSHMKQKMAAHSNRLRNLESKERRISDEINRKKNHKKISIF